MAHTLIRGSSDGSEQKEEAMWREEEDFSKYNTN